MTTILETAAEMLRLDGLATQQPWIWHWYANSVKLVSPPNGRCTVMDFVRQGMRSAQPRFSDRGNARLGGVMHTADEIGDLNTNPDAALIAFSRSAGPALAREVLRLSAEVDALREAQRWIPVGERLPTDERYYLGRYMDETDVIRIGEAYWHADRKRWEKGKFVTHWRELPAPSEDAA